MTYHDITSMEDVHAFIQQIVSEIDDFHPLTEFQAYLRPESYFRRYTDEEAEIRNSLLDQSLEVCARHTSDSFLYMLSAFKAAQSARRTIQQANSSKKKRSHLIEQGHLFSGR